MFTAADLARVSTLRLDLTEAILVDFAKRGLVVRRVEDGGYAVTGTGLDLSRALTLAAPESRTSVNDDGGPGRG